MSGARKSTTWRSATGARRPSEDFLSSMGIPQAQLTIISFGKDRPVCTDKDEDLLAEESPRARDCGSINSFIRS